MVDSTLIEKGTLVTLGENNRIIKNGSVLIEGNKIKDFGKNQEIKEKHDYNRQIDASGKIIMPGLINAHHHLYSTFVRGISLPGKSPKDFLEILEKLWWKLDKNLTEEGIYYSAVVSLIESVKNGTTTVIDHHESQSCQKGALDEIAKAVEKVGLRGSLCLGTSDRYGKGTEGLEENNRFLSKLNSENSEILRGMVGLHASFTVKNETLEKSVEIAKEHGVGIHFHCAEGKVDQEKNIEKYGKRVVERLNNHGVLGEKSIAVHGVHLDGKELELLKESDTNLVHNPESNMNNAVGYSDVPKMLKMGIRVGLGTDGMSSNMLSQTRCAALLHPHEKKNPQVGFSEASEILLENNPKIVRKTTGWSIGKIAKDSLADIILLDYNPPTPFNEKSFLGHLIYGLVYQPVDTTICNGKILMKNKKLVSLDEKSLGEKSSEIAAQIWEEIK